MGLSKLLGREPLCWDARRPQPEDIFERFANLGKAEIDAEAFEQIDQRSRAFGQHRRRILTKRVRIAIKAVIGDDVDRAATGAMADDAEKASRARLLIRKLGDCA